MTRHASPTDSIPESDIDGAFDLGMIHCFGRHFDKLTAKKLVAPGPPDGPVEKFVHAHARLGQHVHGTIIGRLSRPCERRVWFDNALFFLFCLLFTRSSTTAGSAKVDVLPRLPNSSSAILRRMRRMILPERVLGSDGAN